MPENQQPIKPPEYSNAAAQIIDSTRPIITSSNFFMLAFTIILMAVLYVGFNMIDMLGDKLDRMTESFAEMKEELAKQTEIMRDLKK